MRTLICITAVFTSLIFGQNDLFATVIDKETREPLVGANVTITDLDTGAMSDEMGEVYLKNIPDGTYVIEFSYIGYKHLKKTISFNSADSIRSLKIYLEPILLSSAPILIKSTRTNGVLKDEPVRIEVLGSEEVREETAIKPGNISKLLGETTGIQIQQTSASSGNVSFRIQGFDGKYTQLLKDGFPMYSGFSTGLSLLQIPPLDLLQIEVIKGSASALYGGDAIAGIVNIITKKPEAGREWNTILNATHKGGIDISSYYSRRSGKLGVTFLATHSRQRPFDSDKDGFTDIPDFTVTTINPKLYFITKRTHASISFSATADKRQGGDIYAIEHHSGFPHIFLDKNTTRRYLTRIEINHNWQNGNQLIFKNSINRFSREISIPDAEFRGQQLSVFNEVSFLVKNGSNAIVTGINFVTDFFQEDVPIRPTEFSLDYSSRTPGIFLQDSWKPAHNVNLSGSLRADYNNRYGLFFLPYFSVLFNYSDRLRGRFSYGEGYKLPTVFTPEAESMAYKGVRPVSKTVIPETSYGMNWDIDYKLFLGQFLFSVNPVIFYTRISHYISARQDSLDDGILIYENTTSSMTSKGFETNLKISLDEVVLFVDYTYTAITGLGEASHRQLDLTPRQKLNLTLTYEEENKWRTGFEAFYTGPQFISPDEETPDYWTVGIMAQRIFPNVILIGNVENVFDVRQSRFESVVGGTVNNPIFRPIWAPLDGIVANIAVEITI